ncbi:MAG TPA: translation initiation factor IF-2, partial [Xanthomarina gelatinilytica]|nr:translation initiation factor IF-2 [Xanthomarina gelatinilytica]
QKLSGPKIAGDKIDLSQFNKPKKKTDDKKKDDKSTANKKKRRRISKAGAPGSGNGNTTSTRVGNDRFKGKAGSGKGRRNIVKEEPSEEEVQKQV